LSSLRYAGPLKAKIMALADGVFNVNKDNTY